MTDIKIYSGQSQTKAMEIKSILEEANIEYQEVNKMDSSYPGVIGEINIYVAPADASKAIQIIGETEHLP